MCLAVPMKIEKISDDRVGMAEIDGCRHQVNLLLLDDISVGDYVIVHAGFAIERLDQEEADSRLELFAELARHVEEGVNE